MVPAPIYESLPYAYVGGGILAPAATGFNPVVMGFSAILVAVGILVMVLRNRHRAYHPGRGSRQAPPRALNTPELCRSGFPTA